MWDYIHIQSIYMYIDLDIHTHTHIYIYMMEYHLAIKKNEILLFATWMDLEDIMLSEVSQRKTNII